MKNEIIEVDGSKWKVREAVSLDEAMHAVDMARCTGSIGSKHVEERDGVETTLADIVRLNDDGSEREPS